jgi:hypothetical protein
VPLPRHLRTQRLEVVHPSGNSIARAERAARSLRGERVWLGAPGRVALETAEPALLARAVGDVVRRVRVQVVGPPGRDDSSPGASLGRPVPLGEADRPASGERPPARHGYRRRARSSAEPAIWVTVSTALVRAAMDVLTPCARTLPRPLIAAVYGRIAEDGTSRDVHGGRKTATPLGRL